MNSLYCIHRWSVMQREQDTHELHAHTHTHTDPVCAVILSFSGPSEGLWTHAMQLMLLQMFHITLSYSAGRTSAGFHHWIDWLSVSKTSRLINSCHWKPATEIFRHLVEITHLICLLPPSHSFWLPSLPLLYAVILLTLDCWLVIHLPALHRGDICIYTQ